MSDDPLDDLIAELTGDKPLDPLREWSNQIEQKQKLLDERKAKRESLTAARKKLREQMRALQEELELLDGKESDEEVKDNDIKREIRDIERKITEEEMRRAEQARLDEINRRRMLAMAGFHNQIAELKPAWEKYPHDYQWEGAGTLALMGSGLLADEMGLGKTLEAIMWLDLVKARRVLIVGPNETINNFGGEVIRWAPHRFVWTFQGNSPTQRTLFMDTLIQPRVELDLDFTICVNYEQLYNDKEFLQRLRGLHFDAIVIDEAHNMKNKKSLLFSRMQGLCWGVEHILPMTGTFILNQPQDIWPALNLIDPNSFYNEQDFLYSYCEFDYNSGKWHFRNGGVSSLMKAMGGRIVMRTFDEVLADKVPPQYIHEEVVTWVPGTYEDQKKIMRQLMEFSQIVLDDVRKSNVIESLAIITRNRQALVWPAGITINIKDPDTKEILYTFSVGEEVQESIKIDAIEKKVRELAAKGKRIVVFSQFKTALSEIERRLSDLRVVRYDGDTDDATRRAVKNDFDRAHVESREGEYQWDIVLCNYKTGGVGLNFTHATETVILDREWNPGKEEQAYRRTRRMGQTEETHVWRFDVANTIDDWMNDLHKRKRSLVDGFNLEVDLSNEFSNFLGNQLDDN